MAKHTKRLRKKVGTRRLTKREKQYVDLASAILSLLNPYPKVRCRLAKYDEGVRKALMRVVPYPSAPCAK